MVDCGGGGLAGVDEEGLAGGGGGGDCTVQEMIFVVTGAYLGLEQDKSSEIYSDMGTRTRHCA